MFFSVGVETPKDADTAYGLIVPALSGDAFGCASAADTPDQIAPMAREAILAIVDEMVNGHGVPLENIRDAGHLFYAADPEYADYDSWFAIDVDLSAFEGRPQRINVSLPDVLLARIDDAVQLNPEYRDRSHFLAVAARHELS